MPVVRERGVTSDSSRAELMRDERPSRAVSPFPTLEHLVRPYMADAAEVLERVLGGGASVRRRPEQSGSTATLQEFRIEQVVWGTAAFGAAVGGVVLRDQRLTRAVRDREQRLSPSSPRCQSGSALTSPNRDNPGA
ncbi:MAG TPA: hypothetical protein VF082_04840 [Jiangellaceae bacterium]